MTFVDPTDLKSLSPPFKKILKLYLVSSSVIGLSIMDIEGVAKFLQKPSAFND